MILSSSPQTISAGSLIRCSHFPQHHVHLLFAWRQRQNAIGEGLVVVEIAYRLLRAPNEVVAAGHALDADAGRHELNQAPEARAVADQDLGGKPAAQ
jgi:hypothetical protein